MASISVYLILLRHEKHRLTIFGVAGSSPTFIIEDCQINGNTAGERAGGLWIDTSTDNFQASLERCEIQANHSPSSSAVGAFQYGLSTPANPAASMSLGNSLLTGNTGGSTIMLDSFLQFRIINATIADNDGPGIVLGNSSGLTIQNTILFNNGITEFEAVTGNVTVTSNGGSLIGDDSFANYASIYDQQNTNPLLDMAYRPIAPNSPVIDKGVDLDIFTDFDLAGNPRINGCVDIGAFESDEIVTMDCVTSSSETIIGEIILSPNPATDFLNIHLPENTIKPNEISIFDARGRLLNQQAFVTGQRYRVNQLPSGFYFLKLTDGKGVIVGQFIKH